MVREIIVITSCLCFLGDGDHRYLHVLTHSFPTRRSSDLRSRQPGRGKTWTQRFGPKRGNGGKGIERAGRDQIERTEVARADQGQQHAGIGTTEEHTSELQSLMRTSYAVLCLKKKSSNSQTPDRKHNDK